MQKNENFFIFVKLSFNKKLKAEIGLYLIHPRNIFIGFSQVFDTFNRDVIHNSIIQQNVPHKLIKQIKLTMQLTKMKMKVNSSYPEWF